MVAKNKKGQAEEIEVLDLGLGTPKPTSSKNKKTNKKRKKEKESIFTRLKDNWYDLTHKQRTIIIVIASAVLLIVISTLLYIFLTKEVSPNKKKEVVIAKDNYRYEDGTLYFVSGSRDLGSYKCQNKDQNLCYVAYYNNDDDFDETKYLKEDNKDNQERSKIMQKRYVFVFDNPKKDDENIILYDIKENKKIGNYKSIKAYNKLDNNVFAQNDKDKYGLLEFSSNKVKNQIDFAYDYLGIVTEDKDENEEIIVAREDDGYYLIDYDGKRVSKTVTGEIKNYNKTHIKTQDATGKYMLYDYEAQKIVDGLDYIDLLDEYYLTVDNENKLRVKGYDDTKYLEDGIPLYNTDYVKTVTRDKNNKEKDTSYAYTYSLDGNDLIITVNNEGNDEITKINLLEGLASKNYKYINYFNRTIYFYSDEAKTTLINSYRCNNENQITAADAGLTTCRLAFDTNEADNDTNEVNTAASIVPIYDNRYVFINDGNIINLVDLTEEKVMGTYSIINTSSDITKTEPYIETTADKFVIAKNRNNKYGLLKINATSVTSVYNFEYDKLEKLHNYLLASKDGKYFLLDYNGNKITFEFTSPIRNFNEKYVKILNKNKYYVYDYEGNLIFEDGYKYVELYDDYVALVDDANHLSIMDYDGNMLIHEILKLSSTTYYKPQDGYVTAFSCRKEGNKLIITAASSQNTKIEKAKEFIYDLTTKERINS